MRDTRCNGRPAGRGSLRRGAALALAPLLALSPAFGQGMTSQVVRARPFAIERADPALDALIAPDATLRRVATGFGFSDGPVWVKGRDGAPGFLLVSSIIGNIVYKVTAAGHVSVFLDKAGYSGSDFAHDGKLAAFAHLHLILIGPNCTGIDAHGRLIWCAGQDRALMRLEPDGSRHVLADHGDGKRFNGPNDVAIAPDGAIWFTDSDVGLRGGIKGGLAEQPNAVWRVKDGAVTRIVTSADLGDEPNGIALSPDGKTLYLSAGTTAPNPRIMAYPVRADGSVGAGRLFTQGEGIGDGMKTDAQGNLWSTGPLTATVRITSPQGKLLGLLHMPRPASDSEPARLICASALAFGGDDARTLYITACDDIYAVSIKSPGLLQGP